MRAQRSALEVLQDVHSAKSSAGHYITGEALRKAIKSLSEAAKKTTEWLWIGG